MGACSSRQKLSDLRPEQKWDFIVCILGVCLAGQREAYAGQERQLTAIAESQRFQVNILSDTPRLRLPLHLPHHLDRSLRCRHIHSC